MTYCCSKSKPMKKKWPTRQIFHKKFSKRAKEFPKQSVFTNRVWDRLYSLLTNLTFLRKKQIVVVVSMVSPWSLVLRHISLPRIDERNIPVPRINESHPSKSKLSQSQKCRRTMFTILSSKMWPRKITFMKVWLLLFQKRITRLEKYFNSMTKNSQKQTKLWKKSGIKSIGVWHRNRRKEKSWSLRANLYFQWPQAGQWCLGDFSLNITPELVPLSLQRIHLLAAAVVIQCRAKVRKNILK